MRRLVAVAVVLVVAGLGAAGCGQSARPPSSAAVQAAGLRLQSEGRAPVVRLGVVPEISDVTGLVGVEMGYFRGEMPAGVQFAPESFSSDSAVAAAFASGKIDAAYLDPVMAVRLWQKGGSGLVRIVAGAASGGAELVGRPGVSGAAGLAGKKVAVTAGTSQAVALSLWSREQGISGISAAAVTGAASAVREFLSGAVAAAWVPAPFDVELVRHGGHVLAADSPGQFATAELVVSGSLLSGRPAAVTGLLKGEILANNLIATSRPAAQAAAGSYLTAAEGQKISFRVLGLSFGQVTATDDPMAGSVLAEARQAARTGALKPVRSLSGLFDLGPVDRLLKAAGLPAAT